MPNRESVNKGETHMRIGIGIDTGGTCTDAVAYDYETGRVMAKGKVLTTRENLAVGIGKALDALPPEMIRSASIISLSTTLATNACVENKGCRAKLLLFGMGEEPFRRANEKDKYGIQSDSVLCIDTHGSYDGLIADEPDWDLLLKEHGGWLAEADALAAAEMFSMNNGAVCEKRAKELMEDRFRLPFVKASELSSDINVLKRGATALLNARLLPIVREFIDAALEDLASRSCAAPVMIVRSDGSLMSGELSLARPVETILSGPAASVLAGRSFTEREDYLIIDMGGTTTDVSAVRGGKPAMAESGIQIGGWRTQVKGVFVDTFALGGDSAIRLTEGGLRLSPRRVMPICAASQRWPEIKAELKRLLENKNIKPHLDSEFLYLVKEPAEPKRYGDDEMALVAALRKAPCLISSIREITGIDTYHFSSERLEAEGIVMRCGLAPTDFMHIKGDYTDYDRDASELAAKVLLRRLGRDTTKGELASLAEEVYEIVEGHLYENLLRILLMQQYPDKFSQGLDPQSEFLVREAWAKRDSEKGPMFRYVFSTKAALVGIGAPTHVFLPPVAKALGTECILPEHAEVANALGALKADIDAVFRVEISRHVTASGETYYIVHTPSGSRRFGDLEEALSTAKNASEEAALQEARARGALGRLSVSTKTEKLSVGSGGGKRIDLGYTAVSEVTVRFGADQ